MSRVRRGITLASLSQLLHAGQGEWLSNARVGKDVPPEFDCGMRSLAYEYGRKLLPRLGKFEALYYALGLNVDCRSELVEDAPVSGAPIADVAAKDDGSLYVDPRQGSDSNPGLSPDAPLRTVEAALRKVSSSGTIVLRGGNHFLTSALDLEPKHSGLTMKAYPGETPVLSGGKAAEVSWEPHDVDAESGKNIYRTKLDFESVPGLQLDGARATRARYPNLDGGIEVSPGPGGMIQGSNAAWTPPQFDKFGPVKYYTDNTTEHFRNTTTDNWFQHYMIGRQGLCSVYDPPVSYWCSEKPSGGGAFAFRTPSGVTPKSGALPNSPYADASQVIFNVWRPARWANWMFEVAHYDKQANNFTFGAGGNQGARGSNKGGDFFVENVMEELDGPGEFFFNESTKELFLFYNGTGAPPKNMEVIVPQLKVLINMTGSQWEPVKGVTIDGITFKATRYTYMDPHGVPSGGDWALDRISAVFLQGTEGVVIKNSIFERLDGNAVMISGYNRNATVQDSDFAYIGGNAIVSWGYTNETENTGFPYYTPNENYPQAGVDGTDGRHPRYNQILRNSAREVGLYEKQSSFYMQAKTSESTISGNVFFNGPRAGVNFNDGFGGGDELSENLIFSTCRESGDHGPFNSWDRQPYLTSVRTGQPSMIMQWRKIHHNFFIDNYSPQEDVDNDDGSAYYETHHNFLVYGGQGMKADFGGHDNIHHDNIYAYPGQAMDLTSTLSGHVDYFYNNKAVLTGTTVGKPMCQAPKTIMRNNSYFTPTGNITECSHTLEDSQKSGMDQGSTVAKLPGPKDVLTWARTLLSMGKKSFDEFVV